jgi:Fur family ferric uptake transcriptional regulator
VAVQLRKTRQKEAIRTAFLTANRPLSPEETLAYAQEQVDGISMATVYRNIGALVEDKWLMPVEIPGESTRYEVAGKEHHHHFHCQSCGKVFEMQGCNIALKPKLPAGFRVTGHEFFVYGECADCH